MRRAISIGAGPAGLTAGLALLRRTDIQPILHEALHEIGGMSRTVRYRGNRMDIGGHRFSSYKNQDHPMLTAMAVVEGIVSGRVDKAAVWEINTGQENHEERDGRSRAEGKAA